jgi:hypothetical protein
MLRDLRRLLERQQALDEAAFRNTARVLLERQFLFLARPRDREPYRILLDHYDYYRNLFDALGWSLYRDDGFGFAGLVPTAGESFARLHLVETLLILCLRLLYEEGMDRFEVQDGCVFVAAETLLGRYETLLRRERPRLTELRDILRTLSRHGLIETGPADEDELPRLRILPSIRVVTDAQVLERLAAYLPEEPPGESAGAGAEDPA